MAANNGFDPRQPMQSTNDAFLVPRAVYLVNTTLRICHEIDSAYWREWELFHIPGGPIAFVVLHLPLVAFVLYGMMLREPGGGRTMRIEVIPDQDNLPAQVTVHLGQKPNELIGGLSPTKAALRCPNW